MHEVTRKTNKITSKTKIRLDSKLKAELATKLPRLSADLLRDEPDEMDLATFIEHMGMLERITKKLMKEERAVSGSVLASGIVIIISIVMSAMFYQGIQVQVNIPFSVVSVLKTFQLPLDFAVIILVSLLLFRKQLKFLIRIFPSYLTNPEELKKRMEGDKK